MTVGTGVNIWQPGVLSVTGTGAPPAAQIISAQLTYGALGTCQGGTLKLARLPVVAARSAIWQVGMAGQPGPVFAGVIDQVAQQPGELADVPLLAPHRVTLDAVGAAVGSPYALTTYGVDAPVVGDFETMSAALSRALDPFPTADYGISPELTAALGKPDSAAFATYDVSDARTLAVRNLGYGFPDYVTDAVFDPGDGWQKYRYYRGPGDYVLRRTASATADPAIIDASTTDSPQRTAKTLANTISYKYLDTIYADGQQYTYAGNRLDSAILVETGRYVITLPADTPTLKTDAVRVEVPITLVSNDSMSGTDPGDSGPDVVVTVTHTPSGATSTLRSRLRRTEVAKKFTLAFDFPRDVAVAGGEFVVQIEMMASGTGRNAVMQFDPIIFRLTRRKPNVTAVQMPAGWTAPYITGPIFEVKLKGWHIPPFKITGLPGGLEQMAAGATVTFSRNEATTTITTVAWPYEGQRRGG